MSQALNILELSILALTLIITVYFSYQNTLLQKKLVTAEYLNDFRENDSKMQLDLEAALGGFQLYREDKIELDQLKSLLQDHRKRQALFQFLNLYEGLARGVNGGLYDEKISRSARRGSYVRTFLIFKEFIDYHRGEHNRPRAWNQFEDLATRWSNV